MRRNQVLFSAACVAVFGLLTTRATADLIGTVDYSDTFTTNAYRVAGAWPVADVAAATVVENCHGNASRSWSYTTSTSPAGYPAFGSFATDSQIAAGYGYPGGNSAGSNTGITQSGGSYNDFGIAYDLRGNYVVQFDAVQTTDRIDVTTGSANDSIFSEHGLSVFFRTTGSGTEIGLYSLNVGEKITGLSSGISISKTWHNYAVQFNCDAGTIGVYTDRVLRGTIDLKSSDYSAYWNVVDSSTNDYVSVGGANAGAAVDILWTDNFQVGAAVPEPSSVILALSGLVGLLAYAWRKQK
jgi:hypothetical protein